MGLGLTRESKAKLTCDKSIPGGVSNGQAGCFEQQAGKLGELEHHAGPDFGLCEDLPLTPMKT